MANVTLAQAKALLEGIESYAREKGLKVCAAVVDTGGNPVATMRMDDAQLGAYELAIDKAWTGAAFRAPTEEWREATAPGAPGWGFSTVLGGRVVVFAGGYPLVQAGDFCGGVGVSGGAPETDAACARAGLTSVGFEADSR